MANASEGGPVEHVIRTKLSEKLEPSVLDIINESYMHNVPKGSESHFRVVIVSDQFDGIKLLERHRLVQDILSEELASQIHALSIQAKTPTQWAKSQKVDASPHCLGGSKK